MQSSHWVNSRSFHLPTCCPNDWPALVSEFESCPIEDGVWGVVGHTVMHNQVKIHLKLVHGVVKVGVDTLPHRGEVHRVLNDIEIISHLRKTDVLKTMTTCFLNYTLNLKIHPKI